MTSPLAPAGTPGYAGFAIVFGVLWCLLTLPILPLVLFLRRVGVCSWTIEARARPWGRRGPPMLLVYSVKGKERSETTLRELAAALERGEGAPTIPGAERLTA